MRQPLLVTAAAVLGLTGLSVLVYYIFTQPTTLRVAVGPVTNENVRTVTSAIQTLQREREPFRLRLVLTEGTQQTADLLDKGRAELALVRTDIGYPRSGATVAVMHHDHVILVAPGGGATRIEDLAGKSVGLIRDHSGNREILRIVTQQAGIDPATVTPLLVRPNEIRPLLEQGRIAAMLIVGPITGRQVFEAVNLVSDAGKGDITFIAIPETNAIEQRNPLLEADTIVRGSFSGPRPRPERDTPTLTVSHQLMASKSLADSTVADFTRVILNAKAQIATDAPLAARMEAPDQEKASPIPIHPGTITYIDGQTTTFLERYGDWFYIGIMSLGLGGSLLAGWLSVRGARARETMLAKLGGLDGLLSAARNAQDEEALSKIDGEADQIVAYALKETAANNMDAAAVAAFNMALNQVRDAVVTRRRALSATRSMA